MNCCGLYIQPFKRQAYKMVKHTQTIRWQFADKLFQYVWPFCGVGASGVCAKFSLYSGSAALKQLNPIHRKRNFFHIQPCKDYYWNVCNGAANCYFNTFANPQKLVSRIAVRKLAVGLEPLADCWNVASIYVFSTAIRLEAFIWSDVIDCTSLFLRDVHWLF